jgi:glycosyltransferase involved in cell wall biosynthesis
MKLLIYTHAFAPQTGGVETIVRSLADGLARAESGPVFEVTVATQSPRADHEDSALSFAVVRQPRFMVLIRLMREADVVHLAGPTLLPMFLAWLLRKQWVLEHHGFQVICPNGQLVQDPEGTPCPGHFMAGRHRKCIRCNESGGWLASVRMWFFTFVRRSLARRAGRNVTPTEWLATLLKLPRMHTIHHGLPSGHNPAQDLDRPTPAFFFLGRLVRTKGVHVLIAASQRLHAQRVQFQFRIAGEGPERAALTARVTDAGLSDCMTFLGKIPETDVSREMERATATVMPSIGGEVFGLVALESMLRGCPVVASDIGALREVIGDTGMTFRIEDDAELASRLVAIARSTESALSLRKKARERAVTDFSEGQMVQEHCRMFEMLSTEAKAMNPR